MKTFFILLALFLGISSPIYAAPYLYHVHVLSSPKNAKSKQKDVNSYSFYTTQKTVTVSTNLREGGSEHIVESITMTVEATPKGLQLRVEDATVDRLDNNTFFVTPHIQNKFFTISIDQP